MNFLSKTTYRKASAAFDFLESGFFGSSDVSGP